MLRKNWLQTSKISYGHMSMSDICHIDHIGFAACSLSYSKVFCFSSRSRGLHLLVQSVASAMHFGTGKSIQIIYWRTACTMERETGGDKQTFTWFIRRILWHTQRNQTAPLPPLPLFPSVPGALGVELQLGSFIITAPYMNCGGHVQPCVHRWHHSLWVSGFCRHSSSSLSFCCSAYACYNDSNQFPPLFSCFPSARSLSEEVGNVYQFPIATPRLPLSLFKGLLNLHKAACMSHISNCDSAPSLPWSRSTLLPWLVANLDS